MQITSPLSADTLCSNTLRIWKQEKGKIPDFRKFRLPERKRKWRFAISKHIFQSIFEMDYLHHHLRGMP